MIELESYAREALAFIQTHAHLTPYIAFALAFGESIAVLSLFFPATFVLIGLGPIIEAGGAPFFPVWAAAASGAALGDALSYWVGRYFKDSVRHVWPLRNYPGMLAKGERFFHSYGSWSVLIGRFFGPLRAVVPLIAGMFAMPHLTFQLANTTSAMIWAFILLAPGAAAVKMLGW